MDNKQQVVSKVVSPEVLIQEAVKKGANIDVLERLLDLKKKVEQQIAEEALRQALAAFQGEMPVVPKKRIVRNKDGSIRYRYASMDDIAKLANPLLAKYGLAVTYDTKVDNGMMTVIATLSHVMGATKQSTFVIPIQSSEFMNNAQSFAAALTYAKRYAFCNLVGIATSDEDTDAIVRENEKMDKKLLQETEEYKKLLALPEDIRSALKKNKFTAENAIKLCEGLKWNEEQIRQKLGL